MAGVDRHELAVACAFGSIPLNNLSPEVIEAAVPRFEYLRIASNWPTLGTWLLALIQGVDDMKGSTLTPQLTTNPLNQQTRGDDYLPH
jgi:hypothetical protein